MPWVQSDAGVFFVLAGIVAFYFLLEKRTGWRLFTYFPPLLWIYATPVVFNNVGILPKTSDAYTLLSDVGLPTFIVLMLVSIDLRRAVKLLGRSLLVMVAGSVGIVVGAVGAYALFRNWLEPEAWRVFGALSGAWIGGTANMAAVAPGLGLENADLGVAIVADNVVYIVWLPILLSSRAFADRVNRWTRVPETRLAALEAQGEENARSATRVPTMNDVVYLTAVVAGVVWIANLASDALPEIEPVLSTGTWRTLLLTTLSIALSFTPVRQLAGSRQVGMALVYLFLCGMGARASIEGLANAPLFVMASFFWIALHGLFTLLAARVLRVDLHSAAIASAANIGGAVSAPIVAAHHKPSMVPASILMALVGYSYGNYLAVLTGQLCAMLAPS